MVTPAATVTQDSEKGSVQWHLSCLCYCPRACLATLSCSKRLEADEDTGTYRTPAWRCPLCSD